MGREPELTGQTVVVLGSSSGIGLETARRARAEGADVVLTGRNPEHLQRAARELDARDTAAFDVTDPVSLQRFFRDLPEPVDHVMVTAGGQYYARLADIVPGGTFPDYELTDHRRYLTMEYLVTMTTHVPAGTPEQAVDDIRAREAAHSRELAAAGHLLRLWRPPLQPGEWRTLGLFAAADGDRLEEVLASMPLRVWRTDEVTPLSPHPNDPDPATPTPRAGEKAAEFLVTFTLAVPPGTDAEMVADTEAREAQRAHDLAGQGHLLRLWKLPGAGRSLGLWQARDADQMQAILAALPLASWMTVDATPLSPHPSDPAIIYPPATAPTGTP